MNKLPSIPHSERLCNECTDGVCFVQNQCSIEWQKILAQFKTVKTFSAGDIIYKKSDISKGVYIVYSGLVKLVDDIEKPTFIASILHQGELFGYRGFTQKENNSLYYAVAMTDCELSFFPLDIFQSAVRANEELSFYLIEQLSQALLKSEKTSATLAHATAKQRVLYALQILTDAMKKVKEESSGFYTISRKDIANIARTTYETVIRSLTDLQKQGHITLHGKSVKILKNSTNV